MTVLVAVLGVVYGVSLTVLGGVALLSRHSHQVRESLIGADVPTI
jgi:hypothetical protein